jgi:hypothetical protein
MSYKRCGTRGYCATCKFLFGFNQMVYNGIKKCEIRKLKKRKKHAST